MKDVVHMSLSLYEEYAKKLPIRNQEEQQARMISDSINMVANSVKIINQSTV